MERGTTLFLKVTIYLIAIPIIGLCVYGLPAIANEAADRYPDSWIYPLLILAYASAIPFFAALYQAYRLLGYIDRNNAFSELSVVALKKIMFCAVAICLLYAAGLPFVYLIADRDDAPGLILFGMVIPFASLTVAVFAAVLRKLLKHAIDIQAENDLTI